MTVQWGKFTGLIRSVDRFDLALFAAGLSLGFIIVSSPALSAADALSAIGWWVLIAGLVLVWAADTPIETA